VEGAFRRLRWGADAVLIGILLAIPWIRLNGNPLILLDVPGRKFHVFGLTIFPQELYFLWFIVAGLALTLFFFTALGGRLWCGWACPQTVFTDVYALVARRIQRWTKSGPPRRVAPWRKVATHVAWLAISVFVGFHLVGYFRSPYEILSAFRAGEVEGASMGFLAAATVFAYADFGLLRQNFCKYLCPYARFQGVMFDPETLVVAYDPGRGEPRGKKGQAEGDCIDCNLCQEVCPTRIDIREGLQLECIACTQCIDACDEVMVQIGRPTGLIAYRSLVGLEGGKPRWVRPRVVVYAALLVLVTVGFATSLAMRKPLGMEVERNRAMLYQRMGDGRIGNAFTLHLQNRDGEQRVFRLSLEPREEFELVTGLNPVLIPATSALETRVFVVSRDSDADVAAQRNVRFVLEEIEHPDIKVERASPFLMPTGGAR
jgi:cytochrome c oxidase accessory protein FixG